MGTTFNDQAPADTYKDLIHLDQSNAGVAGSVGALSDGNGTTLPFRMSTTEVDVDGNLTADGCYGELYGSSGTIAITTSGTYYGWKDATEGNISGAGYVTSDTAHGTADQLIIGANGAGMYRVSCSISFSGSLNATITGKVYVTGAADASLLFVRKLGTGGDVGSASTAGLASLSASDTVDFRVTADGNTKSITIHALNLSIERIN